MLELIGIEKVVPKLVAQVNVDVSECTFSLDEVLEVSIHKYVFTSRCRM
jgi:hypothetical protein